MPRRDQTPPYEIMRSTRANAAAEQGGDAPAEQEPVSSSSANGAGGAGAGGSTGGRGPWWVGSSSPLVLRVPRGLAVLGVAGLVLLIVLAYWVGAVRGAASAQQAASEAGMGERSGPEGYYIAADDGYEGPEREVPELVVEGEDRRVPGMCYVRVVESTEADCRRIAKFFASRGVAMQVTKGNNDRFRVYVIERAYSPQETESESAQYFLSQMRGHGRAWKRASGSSSELESMYYAQASPTKRNRDND